MVSFTACRPCHYLAESNPRCLSWCDDVGARRVSSANILPFLLLIPVPSIIFPHTRWTLSASSLLNRLAAQTAASFATQHPDYSILAARISVSNLHKSTEAKFSELVKTFYAYVHPKTGEAAPLVSKEVYDIAMKYQDQLDGAIVHARDFEYDYFGFKTMEKSYLLKIDGKIAERPQLMLMRVSVGIHGDDIPSVIETYNLLSGRYFTHATPTLFNAGTTLPQMSSCFLLAMKQDSIDGIYDTLKNCAVISKYAGGIGLSIHNIRASQSYIRGTNGTSNGIVPMLRVFNNTARYVDQGGGKRKGSIAVYLEPWHADVFAFLDLRKNHGNESDRARDLFYAMWTPDLFMQRVKDNGNWSLMCPNECPGLADCYGDEFEALYCKYEAEGKVRQTIKAQALWFAILDAQVETGTVLLYFEPMCYYILLWTTVGFISYTAFLFLTSFFAISRSYRYSVHAVQGCLQPQVQPAELGNHQVQQLVH